MGLKIILTMCCLTTLHRPSTFLIWTEFGSFPLFLTQMLALFFSFVSFYVWFLFFFYALFLYSFSYIIFSIFYFYHSFLSSFWFFLFFVRFSLVSYIVQDHLMFLSFSVHEMLYYKLALGTKGRPNFRTCGASWGQWSFVYLQRLEKTSQVNCRVWTGQLE